jgi:predicted permease
MLSSDLRYAARTLARNPGFAAAAIVTIALGVGVNTGIFTIVNGVLLRDLPAPDAHELVSIQQTIEGVPDREGSLVRGTFSTAEYRALRDRSATLAGIFGNSDPTQTTLGGDSPQQVLGTIVTCEYFDVLQQQPALGRGLRAEDCATGADPVVVLAHELWSTTFESDAGIIGRSIELNRQLFTVVGVAREDTYGGLGFYRTAYFAPISTEPLLLPNENSLSNDNRGWLALFGRRVASIEQVRAELDVAAAQLDADAPGRSTTLHIERATPLSIVGSLRDIALRIAAVLMAPFAFVLLIACANVANLLLARATARSRELAVRFSLGATRARVMRQLLTESALIAVAGGALGSMLAFWSSQTLLALALPMFTPVGVPPLHIDASPDLRVLAVMSAIVVATSVLFGLAPALRASKPDLHAAIKQDMPGSGGRSGGRLQATLVGVQVALCIVLMIGAGLLFRGLQATQARDLGFEYRNVAVASYDLRGGGYDAAEAAVFQRRLLEEVRTLPGIDAAAQAVLEPLRADSEDRAIRLPTQDRSELRVVGANGITPGYFDLIGTPIVRGRAFSDADMTDQSRSVIVTETTARNLWPGRDPLDETLMMAIGPDQEIPLRVVGVVRDAQVTSIGEPVPYYLYLPASPRAAQLLQLLVKSSLDLTSTAAAVRAAVARLDAGLAVQVTTLEANLDYWRDFAGALTVLGAALGLLALALGSVGIYGVVAYFVGRRTREIGIRAALGAGAANVLALILRRTMLPVAIGAVAGIAIAVAVSRVLSSVLFGVSPFDPLGIGAAAVFVLAAASAAALLPARTAVRVQPMAALRYE